VSTTGSGSPSIGELFREWFAVTAITTNHAWWTEQAADDRLLRALVLRLSLAPLLVGTALLAIVGVIAGSPRTLVSAVVAAAVGTVFALATTASRSGLGRYRKRIEVLIARSN